MVLVPLVDYLLNTNVFRCKQPEGLKGRAILLSPSVLKINSSAYTLKDNKLMTTKLDLLGKQFGRLKVIGSAPSIKGKSHWLCQCECGSMKVIKGSSLESGKSQSCGCGQLESITTHGLAHHPLYVTWSGIRRRCHNPSSRSFKKYGAKGRQLWIEWRDDPLAFINYVECYLGDKPSPEHSIDRIDNDGNYEPFNLRWAPPKVQIDNRGALPTGISGFRWVHRSKNKSRWLGVFIEMGKRYVTKPFKTPEEAYEAVCQMRRSMGIFVS